jgi:hypothetical protein
VTKSLAEVAGAQARMLRLAADKSLEDVATAARSYGLRWSTGSACDFENGRATASLKTLLVVAAVLRDVTGRPITLADLFAGNGSVEITDNLPVELSELRAMLGDQPVTMTTSTPPSDVVTATLTLKLPKGGKPPQWPKGLRGWRDPELHSRVLKELRETDLRVCRRIGVEPFAGAAGMAMLWGKTFVAKRDEEAGAGAKAQRRGQISRRLQAELQQKLFD